MEGKQEHDWAEKVEDYIDVELMFGPLDKDWDNENSNSLKSTCLDMYIREVVGSKQIYPFV